MRGDIRIPLADYGIVAFDFDGVILDSNAFKSHLFVDVLTRHGFSSEQCAQFAAWQAANFGTSRYRLFKFVCEGRFGPIGNVGPDELLADFGQMSRRLYPSQPETPGARKALERVAREGRHLYVVSGSDEGELNAVIRELGLSHVFKRVFGSPAKKTENLERVRADHLGRGGAPSTRMVFLGDAMADLEAAEAVGADFVFVAGHSSDRMRVERRANESGWPVIEDLRQIV